MVCDGGFHNASESYLAHECVVWLESHTSTARSLVPVPALWIPSIWIPSKPRMCASTPCHHRHFFSRDASERFHLFWNVLGGSALLLKRRSSVCIILSFTIIKSQNISAPLPGRCNVMDMAASVMECLSFSSDVHTRTPHLQQQIATLHNGFSVAVVMRRKFISVIDHLKCRPTL